MGLLGGNERGSVTLLSSIKNISIHVTARIGTLVWPISVDNPAEESSSIRTKVPERGSFGCAMPDLNAKAWCRVIEDEPCES